MKNLELKFRAFDEINKEMRYSDRHDGEFYLNTKGVLYMYKIPKKNEYYKNYNVMQFTGLKDKNGVEIYEGDLILDEEYDDDENDISSNLEVLYDIETAQYVLDNSYAKTRTSLVSVVDYIGKDNLLVVGNIYETFKP